MLAALASVNWPKHCLPEMYTLTWLGRKYQISALTFWPLFLTLLAQAFGVGFVVFVGFFGAVKQLTGSYLPGILFAVACIQITINGTTYSIIPRRYLNTRLAKYIGILIAVASVTFFFYM